MQYPIIDNLIYAYTANNWSGLGKNIGDFVTGYNIATNGDIDENPTRATTVTPIRINENANYRPYGIPAEIRFIYAIYDENMSLITRGSGIRSGGTIPTAGGVYLRVTAYLTGVTLTKENNKLMLSTIFISNYDGTGYEDYAFFNISHRLKLPMLKYFPHAVIDALISAADGQQTAEENEILRHYLTPLGIGGI